MELEWFPVKVGLRQGCVMTVSLHGAILKITETRVIVNVNLQELYNNNIPLHQGGVVMSSQIKHTHSD